MPQKLKYEERILREIQSLPDEALPKVIRLISLIKEEFLSKESIFSEVFNGKINHERTRSLLSTSKSNWANSIIADRAERI